MADFTQEQEQEFLDKFIESATDENTFRTALSEDKDFSAWFEQNYDNYEDLLKKAQEGTDGDDAGDPPSEATPDGDSGEDAGDGNQPAGDAASHAAQEELEIKLRSDLLQKYLSENQNPAEAIERIINDRERLQAKVDHYNVERMPELEKAREEAESQLEKLKAQIKKYEEQSQSQAAQQQPPAQQQPAPAQTSNDDPEPEEPEEPEPPAGEDAFDDEKQASYREARKNYVAQKKQWRKEYRKWQYRQVTRDLKAEMSQNGSNDRVKELERELQEIKSQNQAASRSNQLETEFNEIDGLIADNEQLFGQTNRSVADIERDYLTFVQDMARINGVQGSIYRRNSNQFRPEVVGLIEKYKSNMPDAEQFRTSLTQRGITLPDDIDTLFNVYQVRKVKADLGGKANYNDALSVAIGRGVLVPTQQQQQAPQQPAPQQDPGQPQQAAQTQQQPVQQQPQPQQSNETLAAYQKRMQAKSNLNQGAAEPSPGDEGGDAMTTNHDMEQKFLKMLDIPQNRRTPEQWEFIENYIDRLPDHPGDENLKSAVGLDLYKAQNTM